MSRNRKLERGLQKIAEHRRDVERRLYSLRGSLEAEIGHAPRGRRMTLLLFAATCGLALALRGKARREGRLDRAGDPLEDL
jgi:hypothetical protein